MKDLQNTLFTTLEQYEFKDQRHPVIAIPIAYPILETTWKVRERKNTSVGLIERHLLRALEQLGPSLVSDLNGIYCFGEQEITDTFNEMIQNGAPISLGEGKYCRSSDFGASEEIRKFESVQTHERELIQDGLSGDPMPINFLDINRSLQLLPQGKDAEKILDFKGYEVYVHLQLSPIFSQGDDSMKRAIEGADRDWRQKLGIPEGAFALEETTPVMQKNAWILAFVYCTYNGEVGIIHGGNPDVTLPGANFPNLKNYLNSFSQLRYKIDIEKIKRRFEEYNRKADPLDEWIVEKALGKMTISIKQLNPPLTLRDLKSTESDDAFRVRLARILARGNDWNSHSGLLSQVFPADEETTRIMLVLRSVFLLRKQIRNPSDPKFQLKNRSDIDAFFSDTQQQILDSLSPKVRCEKISLDSFFQEIRVFPDQEFLEELTLILGHQERLHEEKTKASTPTTFLFNNFEASDTKHYLGDEIIATIKRAKKHLAMISPAVELFDELRDAIWSAVQRGVEVRLITELLDKAKSYPPLPTRGIPGETHRIDHVREMSVLGVLCRETHFFNHAKLVLSESEAILSSANLNSNSLGYGGAGSTEAGLHWVGTSMRGALQRDFDSLWDSCSVRAHLQDNKVNISSGGETKTIPVERMVQDISGCRLVLSAPPNRFTLTSELVRSIEKAMDSIQLCAFSIYDTLEIPELHRALLAARNRGVSVRVFVRNLESLISKGEWPDLSTKELLDAGIQIYLLNTLHAKLLHVDGQLFGCFTGNLNPYSLSSPIPTSHIEMGVFGYDREISNAIGCFFTDLEKFGDAVK